MSWQGEFEQITTELQQSIATCSQAAIDIGRVGLDAIEERYGEKSGNYLAHHSAQHGVDVMRRGLHLTRILAPYIADEYMQDLPDLVVMCGSWHDYEQQKGPHNNEVASSEGLRAVIDNSSEKPWKDVELVKKRAHEGVMATEVAHQKSGEIVQVNLPNGEADPLKYIMAFADINGIAMEGEERMITDSTNLCKEIYGPNLNEQTLSDFLAMQKKFLDSRLNDRRIKSDLTYYFLDDMEKIYKVLREEFEGKASEATILARLMRYNPKILRRAASQIIKMGSILPKDIKR